MIYKSGLLDYLMSLEDVKTIILFGSFVRSDWYADSDIDLFICGDIRDINLLKFEKILNREIQLFSCNNIRELRKFPEKLLRNVIKGIIIKGNIDFIRVRINENYQFA
jgi:predicted nucleotidyltransferase